MPYQDLVRGASGILILNSDLASLGASQAETYRVVRAIATIMSFLRKIFYFKSV